MLWKVPHFEKMLYDNGQLLNLYSLAYKHFQKPLYKRIVGQTVEWLQREMLTNEGAFYSALDADSEGEEGKFYCWTPEEMKAVLGDDFSWVKDFYNLNARGYWEEEKYIPLRTESDQSFAAKMNWSMDELESKIAEINQKLLDERKHRVRPGTDDKSLTSWNAMALKGLCQAYSAFGEEEFLHLAIKNARWILKHQRTEDGKLVRNYKKGVSNIDAFLEDYAHVIDAFIQLYQVTLDEEWMEVALSFNQVALDLFQDSNSKMFYFTADSTKLIARKMEINDNVIPASNSMMAMNLFRLGHYYYNKEFIKMAEQQLANIYDGMEQYGSGYSNWASLLLKIVNDYYQVVVMGTEAKQAALKLQQRYLPFALFAGGSNATLPVTQDKQSGAETMHFVCYDGTCLLPTADANEVLKMMR